MTVRVITGDCLKVLRTLPDESVHCVVTSPPYWGLRDYGTAIWEGGNSKCDHSQTKEKCSCGAVRIDRQIGLEKSLSEHIDAMVKVFREVHRVLRRDGTLWLNYGSVYASAPNGRKAEDIVNDDRTFRDKPFSTVSASKRPSQSLSRERDPAYGIDGKGRPDSSALDYAYSGLCDECLADFLSHYGHKLHTDRRPSLNEPQRETKAHGSGHLDLASPPVSPRDVPVSTMIESWRRLRGECSRCDNRASGLLAVHSSSSDVRASVHNSCLNYSTLQFKPKDLIPVPWIIALALQADGWYLRSDIIWAKPNPMPESATDRPTKAHEYLFLMSKSPTYFYDTDAIREKTGNEADPEKYAKADGRRHFHEHDAERGMQQYNSNFKPMTHPSGRNRRTVWEITTAPFPEGHFATFPPELVAICLKAGTSAKGCCSKCGAPWVRQTERPEPPESVFTKTKKPSDDLVKRGFRAKASKRGSGQKYQNWLNENPAKTLGWSPSCSCNHDGAGYGQDWIGTKPCTVLDPFGGSGTTGMVAQELLCDAILIELNPKYADMAKRRLNRTGGFLADVVSESRMMGT